MKSLLILILTLMSLVFIGQNAAMAFGSSTIELQHSAPKEKFGKNLEYLYDSSGLLILADVLASKSKDQWKDVTEDRPNWGFRDGKLWLRSQVKTPENGSEDWVLDLGFHFFVTANFYSKSPTGEWIVSKAGKFEPFENRDLAYRNPAFIIHPRAQPQEFVLELQSPAVLKIPGRFVPMRIFATDPSQFVFALYIGIVFALAIFHFALGLIARERVYFVYALYAAATLMTICDIEGYSYRFLWTNWPWWFVRSATVMSCLSGIFGLLFVREYIRPGVVFKRLILGMLALQGVFMAVVLLKVNATILMISHLTLGVAVVLILAVAAWESYRKNISARIFLAAFSLFGLGLLVFTLQNMSFIDSTVLTQHGIGIGQATEILLLSIALSVRINEIKKRSLEKEFQNLRLADRVEAARWFAHESRRPYQSIVLGIDNILQMIPVGALQVSLLGLRAQSKRSLARLNSLARNLVFGSSDGLKIEPILLFDVVLNAIEELSESHEGCSVNCSVAIPERLFVFADKEQMTRVLVNLIGNAIEASHPGTSILVKAVLSDQNDKMIMCSIQNTGTGIRSEDLAHVFESRFSQKKTGGMGLGLSMVQKIIKRHGTHIFVTSVQTLMSKSADCVPEKMVFETEFSFELKKVQDDALMNPQEAQKKVFEFSKIKLQEVHEIGAVFQNNNRLKVLLVDDDLKYLKEIEFLCRSALTQSEIQTATSPLDGFICVQNFCPDLVILDVEFDDCEQDGFWLLKKIKECHPSCRVVLHSGSAEWDLGLRALSDGAFKFIHKPMERDLLVKCTQGINADVHDGVAQQRQLPILCIVDDEPHLAQSFLARVKDADVRYFVTPDEFLDFGLQNPEEWTQIKMVLSDYYFLGFNASDIKFVRSIRKAGYVGPVVLFSNVPMIGDVGSEFTAKLDKETIPSLKWLLEKLPPQN